MEVKQKLLHQKWVERYRPKNLDDFIGEKSIVDKIKQYLYEDNYIPSMLFYGPPGTGKTTLSKIIMEHFRNQGAAVMYVNASDKSGVDFIRDEIIPFASSATYGSTSSISKLVVLDEFNRSSFEMQTSLNNIMETYSSKLSFIFTSNFENKIIPSIISRCGKNCYKLVPPDKKEIYKRLIKILHSEEIPETNYDKEIIKKIVNKTYPDARKAIDFLQGCKNSSNVIEWSENVTIGGGTFEEDLIKALKEKNTIKLREILVEFNEYDSIYTWLFENIDKYAGDVEQTPIILNIADYQYKHYFVMDKMINVFALCIEITTHL